MGVLDSTELLPCPLKGALIISLAGVDGVEDPLWLLFDSLFFLKGSITIFSIPLMSDRQKGQPVNKKKLFIIPPYHFQINEFSSDKT